MNRQLVLAISLFGFLIVIGLCFLLYEYRYPCLEYGPVYTTFTVECDEDSICIAVPIETQDCLLRQE